MKHLHFKNSCAVKWGKKHSMIENKPVKTLFVYQMVLIVCLAMA